MRSDIFFSISVTKTLEMVSEMREGKSGQKDDGVKFNRFTQPQLLKHRNVENN